MASVDRHKLHFGPYRTPRFRYGQRVECAVRGELTIKALSTAPIPWPLVLAQKSVAIAPLTRSRRKRRAPQLVVLTSHREATGKLGLSPVSWPA